MSTYGIIDCEKKELLIDKQIFLYIFRFNIIYIFNISVFYTLKPVRYFTREKIIR